VAWSTRQLADLTGVTLRAIRHWHDLGVLPQPDRLSNGYKQYTARHLVLALRIARLTGLGFSLEEVAGALRSDAHGQASLRELRVELDRKIAGLERIRAEIDELVRLGVSPDVSPEALLAMDVLGRDAASRDVAIVLAHLIPKEETVAFVEIVRDAPEEFMLINSAIFELPEDAAADEISALADRAVSTLRNDAHSFDDALAHIATGRRADQADADILTAVATERMNGAQQRTIRLILDRLADGTDSS
jgi:DNA-binding transcriptional MerR regulator